MDLRAPTGGAVPPPAVIRVKKKASWEVSTYGKLYAFLVTVECLTLIVLCVLSMLYAHTHGDEEMDANSVEYTSVTAMVATCALLYFSLDSILLENIFQFWSALALHGLITAYCIWHYAGGGDSLGVWYDRASLGVMCGVLCFQALYICLAYPVQQTFGWRLYKRVGGNMAIRGPYKTATIFFSLMKLDFALGVILLLLSVFYLLTDSTQIAINVVAALATLGWLILGFAFIQRESRRLAPIYFLFAVVEPAFLLYKLISMRIDNGTGDQLDDQAYPVFSWREFLLTGCIAIIVRVACMVYAVWAMTNFGIGLKEKVWNDLPPPAAHTQAIVYEYDQDGAPVVVVEEQQTQERSSLRGYIQPLL